MRSLQKGNNMVTNNRAARYRLVFLYQLLHKGEVVYIGITNNPHARMIEHWQKGFVFDRMEILRHRIERYQIQSEELQRHILTEPRPVSDGMPAGGLEKGDRDEPTQHYLRNKTMTACSLRKKNGAVETTRQRSQVTCGNCLRSQRLY